MPSDYLTIKDVLSALQERGPFGSDRECCIALHDFVRDRIRFGFTAGFERVKPEQTLRLRRGHCNAQADLLRALLTAAGLRARLRFVQLDKDILRHAVPPLIFRCLPASLFHAVTQVQVGGAWLNTDSYIFDPDTFHRQMGSLAQANLGLGFGLTRESRCHWDAAGDAFAQARAGDLREDDPVYSSLAAAVSARAGNNTLLGLHFNQWLALIPGPLHRAYESYVNSRI